MPGTPTALPTTVRFKCSKQLMPGLWHHLVVTMAKDIKKSCKVTAYLNGEMIGTSKVCLNIAVMCSFCDICIIYLLFDLLLN